MAYNCIVVAREIWDTRDLTSHPLDDDKKLKESDLATRFDPEDLNALEMALKVKDQFGGRVTAVSIADPKNVDVLRECLYRGVDDVVRLEVENADKLDTISAAALVSAAIKKIGEYHLVISGLDITEGENAILGSCIAAILGLEQISYVDSLEEIQDDCVVCKRSVEMGSEVVKARMPAAITVGVALLQDDPRTPRSAKATLKLKKKKVPIQTWGLADLGIDDFGALRTTMISGHEAVIVKKIESRMVDPESISELKDMLTQVMKGI